MKNLLILPLLIYSFILSAQDFAPVGAKWCYEASINWESGPCYDGFGNYVDCPPSSSNSYYYYEVTGDSILNDSLFQVVNWKLGTKEIRRGGAFFLYSGDSSVYLRLKSTMLQLYDFKLKADDSIQTELLKSELMELPIFAGFYYVEDTLSYGYKLLNDSVAYYEEYQLYSDPSPVDDWYMSGIISPIYGSSINLLGETGLSAIIPEYEYDMGIVGYSQPGYTMGDVSKCDVLLSEKQKTTTKTSPVNVKTAPGNVVNIQVPESFGAYEAAVVDMQGREVMAPKSFSGNASFKLSGLSPAVYVVKISGGASFSQGFLVPVE